MKNIIAALILFCSLSAFSAPHQLDYTFSLDTSYAASSATNRAFWNFGVEFEYLGASIFDYVDGKGVGSNPLSRFIWALLMAEAWEYPQYSFFVSNHELGHGTRDLAIDSTPTYTWSVNGATGHSSIFSFFIEGLSRHNKGAVTSGSSTTHVVPTEWNTTVVLAGGVNNSQMFAEHLEREVYHNTGHINQYRAYMRAKLDAYNYVRATVLGSGSGDIDQLITIYNGKGFAISADDIKSGSDNSRMLSFTYWAYAWGVYNYVTAGDPTVRPFEVGGFKLPDLSHYLMRDGLSYKLSSSYRAAEGYSIPFAIEKVYKGNNNSEITIGYHSPFQLTANRYGAYEIQFIYNTDGPIGYELSADYLLGNYILSAGYNAYDGDSLIGERNSGALNDSGEVGQEFWARLSLVY